MFNACISTFQIFFAVDYARTIREWDKCFVANVMPKVLAKDFPDLARDPTAFEEFRSRW